MATSGQVAPADADGLASYTGDNENAGATGDRPTAGLSTGESWFDTDLGRPIWWDGTNWVDATGATV